ncbi:MAG TPA: transferase hexapeptide repeat family protein [Saprospiraceae bacterium]|nr:transferase hexapeptide repeat family protein [Saprospiraceae bacterium]HRV86483.1 transferase hexapeptide repeat family protein [Saprospiraceae bacterium]
MIYSFDGFIPVIHPSSFVHPQATVIGNVIIGRDVYIGPGAVLRADWGEILVGDGSNVQENCTVHMFPGVTVMLEPGAHIGHGAVVHGAHIGENVLVGMNAVIMDRVEVGAHSIIGALAFVKEGMVIPERSLVVGNPARVLREVNDEMLQWKTAGTRLYQQLPAWAHATLQACEPLHEPPPTKKIQMKMLENWSNLKPTQDEM